MKFLCAALFFAMLGWGQNAPPAAPAADPNAGESQDLSRAVSEAGNSPVDFIRALENHLAKYPQTTRRNEIERALVKASIEAKDDKRIVEYGGRVLAREPGDAQILDKIVRALLVSDAADTSERALKYARQYEELLRQTRSQPAPGHMRGAVA